MLFSSISFLYVFLPVTLLFYFLVPARAKNYVLLAASLLFYFFGEPVYVVLLLLSSLSDYLHSLFIESHRGRKSAKVALISSIVINLAMLGFFKYIDFFIGTINGVFGAEIPLTNVPLPIGISFFTFQTMSYTIDVYRGEAKAERNLASFATFVCLFPQLIAGPIVRYTDISAELKHRTHSLDKLYLGVRRFVFGLAKKVLIANAMGELCAVFRESAAPSVGFYWLYAVAYSLQIYFDFSGYSDMAIGLGHIFGFHFPENFNYPFISRSITEFWRRWHMTLGGWFRDYLYIPLGGNRKGTARWLLNIAIVWAATGFWHGAAWNFILWGLFFGVLLILEKLFLLKWLEKAGRLVQHLYVLLTVLISFVLFNATDLSRLWSDLRGLFGSVPLWSPETGYCLRNYAVLLVLALVGATPLPRLLWTRLTAPGEGTRSRSILSTVAEPLAVAVLLLVVTAFLVDGSFNPFLYFRF
ncbi:MAG: MBOAT family protein [Oscillospiraceae bacterium]|nr:MBOAT family protein [Oscillospiraceae bacterium]